MHEYFDENYNPFEMNSLIPCRKQSLWFYKTVAFLVPFNYISLYQQIRLTAVVMETDLSSQHFHIPEIFSDPIKPHIKVMLLVNFSECLTLILENWDKNVFGGGLIMLEDVRILEDQILGY